ncbi:hypothetical protein ADUPG1_010783, partial [Aduncisulcus paluster]
EDSFWSLFVIIIFALSFIILIFLVYIIYLCCVIKRMERSISGSSVLSNRKVKHRKQVVTVKRRKKKTLLNQGLVTKEESANKIHPLHPLHPVQDAEEMVSVLPSMTSPVMIQHDVHDPDSNPSSSYSCSSSSDDDDRMREIQDSEKAKENKQKQKQKQKQKKRLQKKVMIRKKSTSMPKMSSKEENDDARPRISSDKSVHVPSGRAEDECATDALQETLQKKSTKNKRKKGKVIRSRQIVRRTIKQMP